MNGVHDMGGMDGFGKVEAEPNEPTFHEKWEGRVMAMVRAMGANGGVNIDSQRFARESLPPEVYLASSYYQKWFLAIENQLIERNMVGADEVAAGHALHTSPPLMRGPFTPQDVKRCETRGSFAREPQGPAKFKPGDKVRAKNINPLTHTRLPRYVRGHAGTIERLLGNHVFPDSNATGAGEDPHWLYTVTFNARELWGPQGDPSVSISVDAWEPYLEKA